MAKTLLAVVSYNGCDFIADCLNKIPAKINYAVLVCDDCSSDNSWSIISSFKFKAVRHELRKGLGGNIKFAIKYAIDNGYDNFVIMAGNNKDDPGEAAKLIEKLNEGYDYVQGSRFLDGGSYDNLPFARFVMVKVHAIFFSLVTGLKFRFTDALNGFRAYRLSLFQDTRFNIWQDWLDNYEFEQYLQYYVVKLGYKITEVSISKTYPQNKKLKYTHIRPVIDWLNIVKPIFYLMFGLRK